MKTKTADTRQTPRKAGCTTIIWGKGPHFPHMKEGGKIWLPRTADRTLHLLKGGEQFLFAPHANNNGVYFGGTDEGPFLTELTKEALLAYRNGGEEAFNCVLKPSIIQTLEAIHGAGKTIRQGDIFAYPMPYDRDELWKRWNNNCLTSQFKFDHVPCRGKIDLFGTRHSIQSAANTSGQIYEGEFWLDGMGEFCSHNTTPLTTPRSPIVLAQGELVGEGHRPVDLPGLCLLSQVMFLVNREGGNAGD